MPENLAVKAVVLTVVFCVGHAVNLAINLLGAYVHTNRLQFVELFSKFYEGGGRAFAPFAAPQGLSLIHILSMTPMVLPSSIMPARWEGLLSLMVWKLIIILVESLSMVFCPFSS